MVLGSVLLVSVVLVSLVSPGLAFEVDVPDSVTRVVDGDTFDTSANGRVRLADVDAPESYEPGFDGATDALEGMIAVLRPLLPVFFRLLCISSFLLV